MNNKKTIKINNGSEEIGSITFIEHFEYIYCELIEIYPKFRRQGYGKTLIDIVRDNYNKPFRYSIVSDSCTGAKFWNEYTKDKNVTCLFGHTYEIKEGNR